MKNWSIEAKITVVGIIVAALIGISAFFVPEVRQLMGFETQKPTPTLKSDNENVANNISHIKNNSNANLSFPTDTPKLTPTPTPTPIPKPTPIISKDIIFNLSYCESTGDKITCKFTVKNTQQRTRSMYFYSKRYVESINTIIIDDKGNSLPQINIKLSNSETERDHIKILLPSELFIDGEIVFSKINEPTKLSLVRLGFQIENEDNGFQVDFTNVPIK